MQTAGTKQFTLSLTYTVNVDESVFQEHIQRHAEEAPQRAYWIQRIEMQQRLLHQLIQRPQELTNVILESIARELDDLEETDWEELLLGRNHDSDPDYFKGGHHNIWGKTHAKGSTPLTGERT